MEESVKVNPLATEKVERLILKFSIPAIISMLVSSLYNIVDQIFIGQGVGLLGNAATNIAFPITIICTATALLLGIGSASNFNLSSGAGEQECACRYAGTGLVMLMLCGVTIAVIVLLFLEPLLHVFGVTKDVLPYAQDYTGITAFGIPFLILTTGGNHLIRADRSPTYSMTCMLTGAIINTILDPLFIFGLNLGIKGAAIATIISQTLSAAYVFYFLRKKAELKVRVLSKGEWKACRDDAKNIVSLGSAGFIMQLTNSLVTICCNSVLSGIGGDVYISVMTIVSSVRQMVETPIYAINEGTSPILSYNYGARRPMKVKKAIRVLTCMILIYTAITWSVIIFEPEFLIGIFSTDRELLADCVDALKLYFAAFIFMDLQYVGQTVFKSLNKKKQAIFFSLLRKVFIVVPLTYLFPYAFHMGTRGVFLAEPISNVIGGSLCFITMLVMLKRSV